MAAVVGSWTRKVASSSRETTRPDCSPRRRRQARWQNSHPTEWIVYWGFRSGSIGEGDPYPHDGPLLLGLYVVGQVVVGRSKDGFMPYTCLGNFLARILSF